MPDGRFAGMAKVLDLSGLYVRPVSTAEFTDLARGQESLSIADYLTSLQIVQLAASEGSTLAGSARTRAPSGVPMSGGAEPAGAAKPSPKGC